LRDDLLDIGEVATLTGLAPSALRYYEQQGLVASEARHGLRRRFSREAVDRLKLIACARRAGFAVKEIARSLDMGLDSAGLRDRLAAKADRLDADIADMMRVRDGLRHAVKCEHEPFTSCPEFKVIING
jgi:DNA-binding transcriptional MerR regulator